MLIQTVVHGADVTQWNVFETSYESTKMYSNAFAEIEVNVVFNQGDRKWVVPAFWAGGGKWTVRFAPPLQGEYKYRIACTDKTNTELNGKEQSLSVAAYKGDKDTKPVNFKKNVPSPQDWVLVFERLKEQIKEQEI